MSAEKSQLAVRMPTGRTPARPLGAVALGRLGDVRGRKAALVTTILLMAIGTAGLGLIPDHGAIGLAAPALLVLCRVPQGLSAGGEWGNATSLTVEWAPEGRRGHLGSHSQVSIVGGVLTSSAVAALLNSDFTPAQIETWA